MYVRAKEYFKDKMYEFDKYMQLYNKYNNHHKIKKLYLHILWSELAVVAHVCSYNTWDTEQKACITWGGGHLCYRM